MRPSVTNMTADERLDIILKYLDNKEQYPESHTAIKEKLSFEIENKDLELILDKLCLDGYATYKHGTTGGQPDNHRYYYITYHGRLFSLRGGYKSQTRKIKLDKVYKFAKTFLIIVNSIVIITIAYWGLDNKQKDIEIKQLQKQVDSLKLNQLQINH